MKIRSMRSTEKTVITKTKTETDAEKILNHSSLKDKVLVEKPKRRNPLVIIYNMQANTQEENILN